MKTGRGKFVLFTDVIVHMDSSREQIEGLVHTLNDSLDEGLRVITKIDSFLIIPQGIRKYGRRAGPIISVI